jgi:DNA-binding HxlR family transcriptional regulator
MPVATLQGRFAARRYRQHCPIARAAELLTEPWTLLVIRECLRGSETAADIARGVSGMSATMLTARLRTLVHIGLLSRDDRTGPGANRAIGRPTRAGNSHRSCTSSGGGADSGCPAPASTISIPDFSCSTSSPRWTGHCFSHAPDRAAHPVRRRTVASRLVVGPQSGRRRGEQSPAAGAAAMRIDGTTSALVDVWRGHRDWLAAIRDGDIRFTGDRETAHAVLRWIRTSQFAHN